MQLSEVLDLDDMMVGMMRRLIARGEGMLKILSSDGRRYSVTDLKEIGASKGIVYLKIFVVPTPELSATSALVKKTGISQERELKKQPDGTYVLRRQEVTESVDHDRPILVSMLAKLISAHFKKDGPPVRLKDDEWDINAPINGYRWTGTGLVVSIYRERENTGQEVTYSSDMIDRKELTLEKSTASERPVWYLKFQARTTQDS